VEDGARVEALLQQQRALASFGELALRSENLDEILTEACRLVGNALGTDLAKVMELDDSGESLVLRAGVGWLPETIGHARIRADERSAEGYALKMGEPIVSSDLAEGDQFSVPHGLRDNGVHATVTVIIIRQSVNHPYGILQVASRSPRTFDGADIQLLRTYANLLAAAVDRITLLRTSYDQAEELAANEERMRLAIDVGRLGTWDWDIPTNEIVWSDEHYRMEGYEVGEVTPTFETWQARIHPDDKAETIAALERARDDRHEYVHEFRSLHPDGKVVWLSARGRFFYDENDQPLRMIGVMRDTTSRRRAQETQKTLIAELQHRTRNLLAVVRSIAAQTMRSTDDMAAFRTRFNERLSALSRVQGLLSRSDRERITIGQLIRMELDALGEPELEHRVQIGGPDVALRNSVVQTLALAIHELFTNARKYGALADGPGSLAVTWTLREDDGVQHLVIDWREVGITSHDGGRTGFGRELIERSLPYQLDAATRFDLQDDHLHCTIDIPLDRPLRSTPHAA